MLPPAEACAALAFGLLRALSGKATGNVCISPVCLTLSLLLAADGAAGETREELSRLLKSGVEPDELCNSGSALNRALQACAESTELDTANALFVAQTADLAASFQTRALQCYGAEAIKLDAASPPADVINNWVRGHTAGRIDAIAAENDVEDMAAVLVSAVNFKARWERPYDPRLTREGAFASPSAPRTVQLMTDTAHYGYFETSELQAVTLGFGNGALGLDVVLPRPGVSLRTVIDALAPELWSKWVDGFRDTLVEMTLPRCSVQYGADLRPGLTELGVQRAFGADADFGPMGLQGHFIRHVRHEVRLRLDEQGAEAAAATAAMMIRSLARPMRVRADRPFMYAIRERATGYLLFVGTMFEPTQST